MSASIVEMVSRAETPELWSTNSLLRAMSAMLSTTCLS
jgi:hypothetical protein